MVFHKLLVSECAAFCTTYSSAMYFLYLHQTYHYSHFCTIFTFIYAYTIFKKIESYLNYSPLYGMRKWFLVNSLRILKEWQQAAAILRYMNVCLNFLLFASQSGWQKLISIRSSGLILTYPLLDHSINNIYILLSVILY